MNNPVLLYHTSQLQEMVKLFQNTVSSPRLTSPLPQTLIHTDEPFQSMIVGGSVFEKAIIRKINADITIHNLQKSTVPLFENDEIFNQFIYSHIDPSVRYVAINFTYPTQPVILNGVIDGRLIKGTKGHAFTGLINKNIGEELTRYVQQKSGKHIIFTLANDTICLLLSEMKHKNQMIAGGVVGTGVNFGFYDGKKLTNLESGNFNGFPQTETGKLIDGQSDSPGYQLFEKEVSGKYLFEHFNLIAKQKGWNQSLSSTAQLSDLAYTENRELSQTAKLLFKRSASLVACQIAGIYQYLSQPTLSIIMEGTVFWTGWNYKTMVEKNLFLLGIPQETIRFIKIEHSNIIGAAKLVLGI